jgi:hypothetical protein
MISNEQNEQRLVSNNPRERNTGGVSNSGIKTVQRRAHSSDRRGAYHKRTLASMVSNRRADQRISLAAARLKSGR